MHELRSWAAATDNRLRRVSVAVSAATPIGPAALLSTAWLGFGCGFRFGSRVRVRVRVRCLPRCALGVEGGLDRTQLGACLAQRVDAHELQRRVVEHEDLRVLRVSRPQPHMRAHAAVGRERVGHLVRVRVRAWARARVRGRATVRVRVRVRVGVRVRVRVGRVRVRVRVGAS